MALLWVGFEAIHTLTNQSPLITITTTHAMGVEGGNGSLNDKMLENNAGQHGGEGTGRTDSREG